MAHSRDLWLVSVTLGLLACGCEVASAAPAEARAAKKAERAAKRAAREAKQSERTPPPANPPTPATSTRPGPPSTAHAAPGPSPGACPPGNPLTFRSFGAGFLRTWCTGCHSSTLPERERQDAPTGVDFDSHARYLPHAAAVYERAVVEGHAATQSPATATPMPPAGLVPDADRRRLAQWIACGSPLE